MKIYHSSNLISYLADDPTPSVAFADDEMTSDPAMEAEDHFQCSSCGIQTRVRKLPPD
ncbi:MAG: hypothetical protein LIO58_02540 [Oscillospiraceae bacterium]|nr:hypothetical protein [Oscillospiraceae bacterium]